MKTRTKQITATSISVAAVAAVIAGVVAFGGGQAVAEPDVIRPASVVVEPTVNPITPEDEAVAVEAREARAEAERIAAEQAKIAAYLEAKQADAERRAAEEAARVAAEQQAAQNTSGGDSGGANVPAQPSGPTKCPAGTTAGQVDEDGNESLCQAPCSEWVDNDGDGNAETCARP